MKSAQQITILEGHLTAGDKKAVLAVIAAGPVSEGIYLAKVGRATYQILTSENGYVVNKFIKDRGLIPVPGSALRVSKYVSKINIS